MMTGARADLPPPPSADAVRPYVNAKETARWSWLVTMVRRGVLRLAWVELLINLVGVSAFVVTVHYAGTGEWMRLFAGSTFVGLSWAGLAFLLTQFISIAYTIYRDVTREYIEMLDQVVFSVTNLTALLRDDLSEEAWARLVEISHYAKAVVYASHIRFARIQRRLTENPLSLRALAGEVTRTAERDIVDTLETLRLEDLQLPETLRTAMSVHSGRDLLNPMMERVRARILTFEERDGRFPLSLRVLLDATHNMSRAQRALSSIRSNVETEVPLIYLQHTQLSVLLVLGLFVTVVLWVEVGYHVLYMQPVLLYIFGGLYKVALAILTPFEDRVHNRFVGKDLREYMHRAAIRIDHDLAVMADRRTAALGDGLPRIDMK